MTTTLDIDGVRSIDKATIELDGPITLLCGGNGVGKTSVLLALKALLTGSTACINEVGKYDAEGMCAEGRTKKASAVLSAGEDQAIATWTSSRCHDIRTPKGVAGLPKASRAAAGLPDFLSMDAKMRASLFLEAFHIEPDRQNLESAITQADLDVDVTDIWNDIQINGWDGAHKDASSILTGLGTEWRQITGEAWTAERGADWAPHCLDESAITEDDYRTLEIASVDAAEKAAQARATYRAIIVPPAPGDELKCPHCAKPVAVQGGEVVKAQSVSEAERERLIHERNAAEGKLAGLEEDARTAEGKLRAAAELMRRSEQNRDQRIKDAAAVHGNILLQEKLVEILGPNGVRGAKRDNMLTLISSQLQELGAMIGMADVRLTWEPEPGKKIDTICARLGDRLFQNLSRSEQWRVRLLIQLLIARRDGSTMVLLDDCEILVRQLRGPLIDLLIHCDINAVAAMSISDGPTKAPDLAAANIGQTDTPIGRTYWVEDGKVFPLAEARQTAIAEAA